MLKRLLLWLACLRGKRCKLRWRWRYPNPGESLPEWPGQPWGWPYLECSVCGWSSAAIDIEWLRLRKMPNGGEEPLIDEESSNA